MNINLRHPYCEQAIRDYPSEIRDGSDAWLQHQLHYWVTDYDGNSLSPRARAWRRYVIREALRRGLIDKDPGGAP